MTDEQTLESWQVEANGQIFDTNFGEMTAWIDEGTLLRQDKVRKGNLRWIEAGKVPALLAVFNAKDNGEPLPVPVITTTKLGPSTIASNAASNPTNPLPSQLSPNLATPGDTPPLRTPFAVFIRMSRPRTPAIRVKVNFVERVQVCTAGRLRSARCAALSAVRSPRCKLR